MEILTRNDHSAAAHDADDIHRAPWVESQLLLALINAIAELADKDETEVPDGDGFQHDAALAQPDEIGDVGSIYDAPGIVDHVTEAEADCERNDDTRHDHHGPA